MVNVIGELAGVLPLTKKRDDQETGQARN